MKAGTPRQVFLFTIFLLAALGSNRVCAQQPHPEIDRYLEEVRKIHEVPGMAVAVVQGDQLLYRKYLGLAELNHQVPVSEQTVFRVYSTTKVLVTTAIFQLAEMGKLSIDDSIGKYLDDLPAEWEGRRIKDLLAHSSGLPNFVDLEDKFSERELADKVYQEPLSFQAGERFDYNQTNFWLLDRIIRKTSGLFLTDFIKEHQLGGTEEGFVFSSNAHDVFPHRVGAYRRTDKGWVMSGDEAGYFSWAANGLAISLPLFIEWSKRLNTGKLLKKEGLSNLLKPYTFQNDKDKFLHGWGSYPVNGHPSAGFTGGWVSGFRYFPEQDISIIYLSNGLRYFPIHNNVINRVAGMLVPELEDNDNLAWEEVTNLFLSERKAPLEDFAAWRTKKPDANVEGALNSVGYALMGSGRMEDALRVFQLNVREYPEAWNVYDSLGEVHAKRGAHKLAKKNYQKSLELNPENENAKIWLERLTVEN